MIWNDERIVVGFATFSSVNEQEQMLMLLHLLWHGARQQLHSSQSISIQVEQLP